ARFGLPEIRLGILAGGGGCTRLPRTVPAALAAEMVLTGRPIDADRALQAGLVSELTTPENLLGRALELAMEVAARPVGAVLSCTALLRHARYQEMEEALALERRAFARLVVSREAQEGMSAFLERPRSPPRPRSPDRVR